MSLSDGDLREAKAARNKLRADYDVAKILAQLLFQAIIVYKEEWSLDPGLCEGFQVEVENIKRVGLSLTEKFYTIDFNIPVYMARLRRCYDEYEILVVGFKGGPMAAVPAYSGEETKSIPQKKPSNQVFMRDCKIKDEILWSTPKLLDVLEQSRNCTSKLLNCNPLIIFTIPTLEVADVDLEEDSRSSPNCSDADNDAVSSQSKPDVPVIWQHMLGNINPVAEYQIMSLIDKEAVSCVFAECKRHDCFSDAEACASVHKNLLRLAEHLHRLYLHENAGLLSFRGLVKFEREQGSYAFVYNLPRGQQERAPHLVSLRDLIARTASAEQPPPKTRLQIAKKICSALSRLHAGGILHKNIRKRSVVFFCTSFDAIPWDSPYLVNFDFSRPIREQTSYNFACDLERDISQHPACQGAPRESFTEEHDVYALGVVLLEIGLWSSARDIFTGENNGVPPTKSTSPVRIQNRLRIAVETLLPVFLGHQYADVVMACLNGSSDSYRARDSGLGIYTASIAERIEKLERDSQDGVTGNSLEISCGIV